MPFRVALSGLNAASTDLSVTANNIANANTIGFKGSRAEFSDVFAAGAEAIGNGTRLSSVTQTFTQGGIDFTDRELDLAISGEGFFTLSDNGSIVYSRVGSFGVDRDGYIVNTQNQRLQTFPVANNGTFNTGTLTDMRLATTDSPPQASSRAEFGLNLPGDATPPAVAVFDPANASSFNHSTALTLYDSLGATHTLTVYFAKDAAPNTWNSYFFIDGSQVGGANQMVYSDSGTLQTPASGGIALPAFPPTNGAATMNVTADFLNSTQYGSSFGVNLLNQDGFAAGRLSNIDVDQTGVVFARFTNGRSAPLGQVALSNFANPQGLRQIGDTSWVDTFTSGDPIRGAPGSGSLGLVQSGALEASNVDLTEQLVQMISTADQVTQTIINIR